MARIRIVMASLGAAAAAVSATLAAGASASAGPAPVTAHVWVTTPDGTDKLTALALATFGSAMPSAPTIVVDPTLTYQLMQGLDRKSTRLNSSHMSISYAVFCLKKTKTETRRLAPMRATSH